MILKIFLRKQYDGFYVQRMPYVAYKMFRYSDNRYSFIIVMCYPVTRIRFH
jgi:hypothetical protein